MMKRLLLALALVALPAWAAAYTETFYLCATGDNSAPEDATCAHAFNATGFNTAGNWDVDDQNDAKIGPNDLVTVLDDGGAIAAALVIQQSGLAAKPITIQAETGGTPVITGSGVRGTGLTIDGKSYITIVGLEITANIYYGIFLDNGSSYVTIRDCYCHTNGIAGLQLYDSDHSGTATNLVIDSSEFSYNANYGVSLLDDLSTVTVTDNTFHHNSTADASASESGLYIKSEDATRIPNVTVTGNTAYSNGGKTYGSGIYIDTTAGATTVVRYNSCYNNVAHGIVIEYMDNSDVAYNTARNNGAFGISLWRRLDGTKLYNNTSTGNVVGISLTDAGEGNTDGNLIKNNISSGNSVYEYSQSGATNTVISNNCFGPESTNFVDYEGPDYSTYDAWETARGGTTNSVESDPLLSSATDLHLLSGSPAINAGASVGLTKDGEGDLEGTPDVGAYEYRARIGSVTMVGSSANLNFYP